MNGPYAPGTLDCSFTPSEWAWENNHIKRSHTYRVAKAFFDADGDEHAIGEEWVFLTSMFSRYDDELTLCVRSPSREEWKIPLIWKPEAQRDVIENFLDYVEGI
jgi:hypothetical protein